MDIEPVLLSEPNADDADSLASSNEPDDLDNEQTWPTEEEMNGALGSNQDPSIPGANPGTTPKAVKKIPKGMNEYMASWIIDETDDEDENDSDHSYDEMQEEEMQEAAEAAVEDPTEIESERHVTFQDLDEEEEAEQYAHFSSDVFLDS
jgi:pre-rRNA-processing protein TSR1